jgi:c-di-AMP phosphodiesterase-like protein
MRFVFKLLLVSIVIFSVVFVVNCFVDNWLYHVLFQFLGVCFLLFVFCCFPVVGSDLSGLGVVVFG